MSDARDAAIDAGLRDVPVPAGLPARVAPAALFDDATIDRLLARIAVPAGLGDRVLRGCLAARPGLLAASAGPVPPPGRHRAAPLVVVRRLTRSLVAVSTDLGAVAVALGLVGLMFLAGRELSRRMADQADSRTALAVRVGRDRDDDGGAERHLAPRGATGDGGLAAGAHRPALAAAPPALDAASRERAAAAAPAAAGMGSGLPLAPEAIGRPVDQVAAAGAAVGGGGLDVRGAPDVAAWVEQPRTSARKGMRLVTVPRVGRTVPRTSGFDLVFEMTHGESPFVDPGASGRLAADRPPLTLRTDSFDALVEQAARDASSRRGRGAPTRRVAAVGGLAVEELLAALPPRPAAAGPRGPARLTVSGVRSLRPDPGSTLVEVCAAPPAERQPAANADSGADVMLVVDASADASSPLSWTWVCRGLARIVAEMRAADRVTVVVGGPRPRVAALRADATALRRLLPELEAEPVSAVCDLDAAFRLVAAVTRAEGPCRSLVAVARAETADRARDEGRSAIAAWREGVGMEGTGVPIRFVVVDPREPAIDATARTGAAGRVAADAVSIGRAMLAEYLGRPTLAATGCRLQVGFDPRAVAAYRVVGFRQTAADAVSPAEPAAIDMHLGEWVRVVYEVVPRTGATASADAVTASFEWTSAGADAPQRQQSRWRFPGDAASGRPPAARRELPPPADCELLLAVACGEIAAGSPHAEPRRQWLSLAGTIVSRWKSRGDVTPAGAVLGDALQRLGMPQDASAP